MHDLIMFDSMYAQVYICPFGSSWLSHDTYIWMHFKEKYTGIQHQLDPKIQKILCLCCHISIYKSTTLWLHQPSINIFMWTDMVIFTDSAIFARSVIESWCPSVCMCKTSQNTHFRVLWRPVTVGCWLFAFLRHFKGTKTFMTTRVGSHIGSRASTY